MIPVANPLARLLALALVVSLLALAGCADDEGATTRLIVHFSPDVADAGFDVAVRSDLDSRPTLARYETDRIPHPDGYTAHDQLEDWVAQSGGGSYAATAFNSSFGAGYFLTAINGEVADGSTAFWSLSVNGQESLVGMSEAVLHDGDTVTWTYTTIGGTSSSGSGTGSSSASTIRLEPVPPTQADKATLKGTVDAAASLTVMARRNDAVHFQESVAADGAWSLDVPLEFGHNVIDVFDADGGFANLTVVRLAPMTMEILYTAAVPPHGNSNDEVWFDIDGFASAPEYVGKPRPHPGFPNVHDAMVSWEAQTGNVVEYSYHESFDFGVDRINGAGSTLDSGEPPWWTLKVNGATADFGITLMPIAPGDTVTWELLLV